MAYKHPRFPGIALLKLDGGSRVPLAGETIVVMVGDDTPHAVRTSELVEIPDDAYCRECGQLGCRQVVYVDP